METIIITPRSQEAIPFLTELLGKLHDVKKIEIRSETKSKGQLYKSIDSGLKDVKNILDGKKEAKSFDVFLNEL